MKTLIQITSGMSKENIVGLIHGSVSVDYLMQMSRTINECDYIVQANKDIYIDNIDERIREILR